jgi:hypothetical protein
MTGRRLAPRMSQLLLTMDDVRSLVRYRVKNGQASFSALDPKRTFRAGSWQPRSLPFSRILLPR